MPSKLYLPGLNGIRAIAALAVIFSHIGLSLELYGLPNAGEEALATYGVTFFFALSGFLITYLLLKEKEKTNTIAIKKFYFRRILRIWPLYYFYIILVAIIIGIQYTNAFWAYLFLLPNVPFVTGAKIPYISHYWSVGVEEQFYAFWPWLVKKVKNIFLVLVFFVLLFILLKIALNFLNAPSFLKGIMHVTRFDCLGLGGITAILLLKKNSIFLLLCKNKIIELISWGIILLIALNKFHLFSAINHNIAAIFVLIIIVNQVDNPKRLISLENRVFDYLGKISYGLYIYNPLVIYLISIPLKKVVHTYSIGNIIIIYAVTIFCVIVISHLSYFYFEKWFLRFKDKFAVVKSKSSAS